MKLMSVMIIALAITGPNPGLMIPSAQDSGSGIYGLAGAEAGPAVRSGTVGLAMAPSKYNLSVSEQDAANIPALPGTEAGPSVKPPT
jgi:hypothetical protein